VAVGPDEYTVARPYAVRKRMAPANRVGTAILEWPTLRPDVESTEALRPDPSRGVFETLLVADGEAIELEAHIARLVSSTSELFGADAPAGARALVQDHARGVKLGRLRLDVAPDADGRLAAGARVAEVERALVFPSWERAVTLAAVVVPGGIGRHKWSDRRLLDQAQSDCGTALPLVVDADGTVLEVSRGNVFLVRDGSLLTPAADGRLLPGVARRRIVEVATAAGIPVREQAVYGGELAQADEVFVSGSVRGVEPVRGYEEVGRWEPGDVTPAISAGLRRLWLRGPDRD
jgi:para-aminobenzoate synthetase / 4-amino-4-deoxychorismate lyase